MLIKQTMLATVTTLLAFTTLADEVETNNANVTNNSMSDYKQRVEKRQNPNTSISYEAIDPNHLPEKNERWSDFLPIWGKEAREQGYVLPLPFGISIIGLQQRQPFQVNNIGLAFKDTSSQLIDNVIKKTILATDLTVEDSTINARADVWLFPFLNIYALVGQTDATSRLDLNINASIPDQPLATCNLLGLNFEQTSGGLLGPKGNCLIEATTPIKLDIKGDNIGAGMTIAGGYGDFFGMLDVNFTSSDLDIAEENAEVIVTSARIGWNGAFGALGGSLWLGAMHQNVKQTLNIPIPGIANQPSGVKVIIEQEASSPVNYLLGGRLNFTEAWEMIIETNAGFADRQQFLMQISYRL